MDHIRQFDKMAENYGRYNIIQKKAALDLLGLLGSRPEYIVDLGCGSGTLYNLVTWPLQAYIACDKSAQMLRLHPTCSQKLCCDFDAFDYETYRDYFFLSSAALQWAQNLDNIFSKLRGKDFALSLFTANTFASLHRVAGITSPIYTKEAILASARTVFGSNVTIEVQNYFLRFEDTMSMLRYIKRSGVSGGKKSLGYKQIQNVLRNYNKDYLEFEVVFLTSPQIPAAHDK